MFPRNMTCAALFLLVTDKATIRRSIQRFSMIDGNLAVTVSPVTNGYRGNPSIAVNQRSDKQIMQIFIIHIIQPSLTVIKR